MGLHYKYASDAEATAAARLRTKKYIERIGIENYKAMVRKMALACYYKKKELHKNDPKPPPKKLGRPVGSKAKVPRVKVPKVKVPKVKVPKVKVPKEPKPKIPNTTKAELYEKIKKLEDYIKNL